MCNLIDALGRSVVAAIVTLGLLATLSHPQPATAADPQPAPEVERGKRLISIGVLAKRGKPMAVRKWRPTAHYLQQRLPDYRFQIVPLDFKEIFSHTAQGMVHFVLANSAIYVKLEHAYGVSRVATLKNRAGEQITTRFGGVLFARSDNDDINQYTDVAGHRMSAVNEDSLGGFQMVWRELKRLNVQLPEDLDQLFFTGTHDGVVESVMSGRAEVGTVRTDTLERMAAEGLIKLEQIKVIPFPDLGAKHPSFPQLSSTRLYPEWPLAKLEHTSQQLAEDIVQALLAMPQDAPAAQASYSAGWSIPSNYQPVHDLLRELKLPPYDQESDITLQELITDARFWLTVLLLLLFIAIGLIFYTRRHNRGLLQSEVMLREYNNTLEQKIEARSIELEEIIESLPGFFYQVDSNGKMVRWNRNIESITGYRPEEIEGQSALMFFDPEHQTVIKERIAQVFALGHAWVEAPMLTKMGKKLPYLFNGSLIHINGEPMLTGIALDITQRINAEAALYESEKRFRLLAAATVEGVLISEESLIKDVNPAAMEMFGYSQEQMIGLPLRELAAPESLAEVTRRIESGYEGKYQTIAIRQNGTRFHAEIRGRGMQIGQRHIRLSTIRDVTEWQRMEHTLRRHQKDYETILESVPAMIFYIGSDHRVARVNAQGARMVGKPVSAIIGKMVFDLFPAPYAQNYHLDNVEIMRTGVAKRNEQDRMPDPHSGEERWITIDKVPSLSDEGEVLGITLFARDVTEQQLAKQALESANKRFDIVLNSLDSYVYAADIETHEVLYMNPAAIAVYGNAIGKVCWKELQTGQSGPCAFCTNDRLVHPETNPTGIIEWEHHNEKSGRWFAMRDRLIPWLDGRQVRFEIATDITNLKETQLGMEKAKERADLASRAKSEFLATMSHELRTPLNVVLGMGEMLHETELTHEQQAYLDRLGIAGRTLLDLIQDILDLSRIESGQLELLATATPIRSLIAEIHDLLAPSAHRKGLSFRVEIAEEIPEEVVLDPGRLRQVLVNLLSNAIKFTEQGFVALQLERRTQHGAHHILFHVSDSGIGISEENKENIFNLFQQEDSSITRKYGGTGLGLAISKRLVKLWGGELELESTKEQGSCFSFTLPPLEPNPLLLKEEGRPAQTNLDEARETALQILLAEDSPDNQALIKAFLKKSPHTLTIVDDGAQALEIYQRERFDLIFMDVQMPVMDGFSATRAIRQWEKDSGCTTTPLFALTAHALQDTRDKALAAGCDGYLTKPISKANLLQIIQRFSLSAVN
uniref:histidine kinase n=1 Tax=Magnetococcus massalia (strain MO-1) TaxID=451514 RepID=A0A1S7LDR0_MAGMO|nr:putative Histidine kinase [Candidatus Magnetococcus massalia]